MLLTSVSGVACSGAGDVTVRDGVSDGGGIVQTGYRSRATAWCKQTVLVGPTLDDYHSPLTSELRP